jgi:hypothetical protein
MAGASLDSERQAGVSVPVEGCFGGFPERQVSQLLLRPRPEHLILCQDLHLKHPEGWLRRHHGLPAVLVVRAGRDFAALEVLAAELALALVPAPVLESELELVLVPRQYFEVELGQ